MARNKQDLLLKLAGGASAAARRVRALAPVYSSDVLNRSRYSRHWYVTRYFERAARRLGLRRAQVPLSWLLLDMARGITGGGGEWSKENASDPSNRSEVQEPQPARSCDVYSTDAQRRCAAGECAGRARALAYVHHADGLLDVVNERLLRQRVGTRDELDTVQLYQQPQGLYSLRHTTELWDVRHLHSRFVPQALLFAKRQQDRSLTHLVPFHAPGGQACTLWKGWKSCLACENSSTHRACLPWG